MQPNSEPGVIIPSTAPLPKPMVPEDEACLPWVLPVVSDATVSAVRLGVPGSARSQYEKACSAYKKNKLTEAERHARDAIEKYPNYSAAWVMLGQVLQNQKKLSEAQDACAKPMTVEPTYLPPYLCLAGLLDHEKEWNGLLALSDRFPGTNPAAEMYGFYDRAMALFQLHNLPEAQKSALRAIEYDGAHQQPGLHFLLAQIYGEQGDLMDATIEVQQFQKFSSSRQDKDSASEYLTELQGRLGAKSAN